MAQTYDRRRNYYIKKEFQRRFVLRYIVMVVVGVAVAGGILYVLLNRGLDEVFYRAHIGIVTTGDVTRSPLIITGVAVVAVAAIVALAFTVSDSNRINRNLSSLVEGVKGLRNGDLTVRMEPQDDDLGDLAQAFNDAVSGLNDKVLSTKRKMDELEEAAEKGASPNQLLARIEALEKELSVFKLEKPKK